MKVSKQILHGLMCLPAILASQSCAVSDTLTSPGAKTGNQTEISPRIQNVSPIAAQLVLDAGNIGTIRDLLLPVRESNLPEGCQLIDVMYTGGSDVSGTFIGIFTDTIAAKSNIVLMTGDGEIAGEKVAARALTVTGKPWVLVVPILVTWNSFEITSKAGKPVIASTGIGPDSEAQAIAAAIEGKPIFPKFLSKSVQPLGSGMDQVRLDFAVRFTKSYITFVGFPSGAVSAEVASSTEPFPVSERRFRAVQGSNASLSLSSTWLNQDVLLGLNKLIQLQGQQLSLTNLRIDAAESALSLSAEGSFESTKSGTDFDLALRAEATTLKIETAKVVAKLEDCSSLSAQKYLACRIRNQRRAQYALIANPQLSNEVIGNLLRPNPDKSFNVNVFNRSIPLYSKILDAETSTGLVTAYLGISINK